MRFLLPGLCAPLLITGGEEGVPPGPPTVTGRKCKGPSAALHVVMRPCGAPGASSSGHSLEVIVLHLVPATATATAGPHPLALHSCPYHQRLRCSGQEAASTSGGSKWASQDTSGHWPCVNALARHTKATLCQTSTSVQRATGIASPLQNGAPLFVGMEIACQRRTAGRVAANANPAGAGSD